MRAMSLLMRRDLRKRPGQMVALLALTLVAAGLLNLAALLSTGYRSNIGDKARHWRSPDALAVTTNPPGAEAFLGRLRAEPAVATVEAEPAWIAQGRIDVESGSLTSTVVLFDMDAPGALGRFSVVEETARPLERPLWVPIALAGAARYRLGDPIAIHTSAGTATFHVAGFIESTYSGSPGMGLFLIGQRHTDAAANPGPGFGSGLLVKVDAGGSSSAATSAVESALVSAHSAHSAGSARPAGLARPASPEPATDVRTVWMLGLDLFQKAATTSTTLFVAIMIALALIILVVTAIVMRYLLGALITTDMPSIGSLRAAGFTTGAVMAAVVGSSTLATAVGAVAGVGVSYAVLPAIAATFQEQSGIVWDPSFAPVPLVAVVALLVGFMALISFVTALRVRRVSTVAALREGLPTHSFRTTRFPLDRARGPLPMLLGLKASLRHLPQTLVVAVTIATATFAAVVGLNLTVALLGDPDRSTRLLVGQVEDVSVVVKPTADLDALAHRIETIPHVTAVFPASNVVRTLQGTATQFLVTDRPELWQEKTLSTGRLPRHTNEVALGVGAADRFGVDVGDTLTLDLGAGSHGYVVTGLLSTGRTLGQVVLVTTGGFQQLVPGFTHEQLAVMADDRPAVVAAIGGSFADEVDRVVDVRGDVLSQLRGYLSAVPLVRATVLGLTGAVTVLVVTLVVGGLIVRSRRTLGVSKAFGFTLRDLMRQVRWTLMPAVAGGVVLGAVVGAVTLQPLVRLLFRPLGLVAEVTPEAWLVVCVGVGVLVLAWLVTWVAGSRMRRISAYSLVTE